MFKRFLLFFFLALPILVFGNGYRYWQLLYRANGVLYAARVIPADLIPGWAWVHANFPELDGQNPYNIKGTDPAIWLVPHIIPRTFDLDENDVNNLNNYFSSLEDPLTSLPLIDFQQDPTTGLPKLKAPGTPILGPDGTPYAVVGYDASGSPAMVSISPSGNGHYLGYGHDSSGNPATYELSPGLEGAYDVPAVITPSSQGGGEGGTGGPQPGQPEQAPVNDNIAPVQTNSNGTVSTPSQTVQVSDGNGGQVSITTRDYTPLLSQIAKNQIEGINRVDADFSTLNTTLQDLFSAQNTSVLPVSPDSDPDIDFSSVESDKAEILGDVSGWDFSFGFSQNPVGSFITALIGNPPTSFGHLDQVWSVDFPIYGELVVHSTFKLSDYFIPAFRSCILMILTIVFAIAIAKQISNAFS